MLKKIILCAALILPVTAQAQAVGETKSTGDLNWTVMQQWTMKAKPLSFVQSLDNKKVFVLGADAQVHIFTPDGKKLGSLPVDPAITAIDIAPRGEMIYLVNSKDNSYTAIDISFTQNIDITGAAFLGNANAPVTLIEFSDFECPYCSKVKPLLDQLLTDFNDKVKIVFKHMPLRMHPQAEPAARASIAAQKQDKFWEMHDALFAEKKITAQTFEAVATKIGLDIEKFKTDMESPETRQQLGKDMFDGQKADVSGTPTLFINGVRVKDRSINGLKTMIETALANAGAK